MGADYRRRMATGPSSPAGFGGVPFTEAMRRHGDERAHHKTGLRMQSRAFHGGKGRERNSGKHSGTGELFEERTAVYHKHL